MKLIFGLGNHTSEYVNTYHNIGFMVIDEFCRQNSIQVSKKSSVAKYFEGVLFGEKVVVVMPTTFMNLSGNAVAYFVNKFKAKLEDILVVYDDIDLPLGELRYRTSGSAGTHNGMRDIVAKIASTEFSRLRVGIRMGEKIENLAGYVLSKIGGKEKEILAPTVKLASELIVSFIENKNIFTEMEAKKYKC